MAFQEANNLESLREKPLLEALTDGSFHATEVASGVVPFKVGEQRFDRMFILVDGIYPRYSRFVKCMKEPITDREKSFTGWQESARKDIERAFGVLQGKFQVMARPLMHMDMSLIASRVQACVILHNMHNMCVSDRVMDDVFAMYNPANNLDREALDGVEHPNDLSDVQGKTVDADRATIGIGNVPLEALQELTRRQNWDDLNNLAVFNRLHTALMDYSQYMY